MSATVLEVNHLTKRFGSVAKGFTAVKNISFAIKEGEIVGLLGPNGAGKTTTIQMLLSLIIPTSGSISYFGKDFVKNREESLGKINYASAYSKLQAKLTVRQNLTIYAGLYEVADRNKRISEVASLLEINDFIDELFWKLSSGQKTRVILAKALLNHPKIILMDEPTASLDPDIAAKVIDLVREMQKSEKVALLYTSHNMDEVEKLCDRVMFLSSGEIVAEDTPLGLTKRVGKSKLIITFDGKDNTVTDYLKEKKFTFTFPRPQVVEVDLEDDQMPKVLFGLSERKVWLTEIDVEKPDLEDVFLSIVKGSYEYKKN